MTNKEIISYVFGEAAKSNIEKRKVGCLIIGTKHGGMWLGHNYSSDFTGVITETHAEIDALNKVGIALGPFKVYVSHPPCPDCAARLMQTLGSDTTIEVVKEFMKFDGDKTRYDLVPPSAIKAMAEVLTVGARKYKPNNWKLCEDKERYLSAMYRHIEAWRSGEVCDAETGLHHLAHAMTNMAFMLDLDYNPKEWTKD